MNAMELPNGSGGEPAGGEPAGIQGPPVAVETSNGSLAPIHSNSETANAVANEHCPQHQFPVCPIPSYILKIPPRKAPAPVVEPAPTPAEAAVSLEFLRAFMRRIPGGAAGGATMARVVEELVRPSTSATMSSYASQPFLVPRSHVSTPTWVVIHPWDVPLADLVSALEDFAAGLPAARTYFWLRALAVSQHLMGPEAALQPLEGSNQAEERDAEGGGEQEQPESQQGSGGGSAADAAGRALTPVPSFGTMLRKRQLAMAARQHAAVRVARLETLAATRAAVAASRCGALLMIGRDWRPLRRGWCLVEAAEALRARGPEAITVLSVDKAFTRADLVRQLREVDVAEAVMEADEHDREVLSEVLGVPPPPPRTPSPQPPAGEAAGGGTATATAGSAAAVGSAAASPARMRSSAADPHAPHSSAGIHRRSSHASGTGSVTGGPGVADPGVDDGSSGGRALVRQLQLALLLRPMDGVLPARMLDSPIADANPVATTAAAATGAAAGPAPATAVATPTSQSASPSSASVSPCGFDWLWDWSPLTSWLALPPVSPSWPALLVTGTHGSGKTTAMAAALARLAAAAAAATATHGQAAAAATSSSPPMIACHFCSAADVRSLVAGQVVRSLSYQLSCRSPVFGAALCRSLLELGGDGGGLALTPDGWLHGLEEVVAALLRKPMEVEAEVRAARGDPPASYVLVIDGLDEGPASAASATTLVDTAVPEDTGPPACPGPYEVLRLVVDHLRHLPGVRLLLSCTAAADSGGGAAAAGGGGAAAPRRPYDLPPPVIVAPRVAADASASVHLALRRALQPLELPLTSLRRDKHLPLALAHMLQEYVLSPELTAQELLWQARGCLAHVHILQLLVQHAAEQLGPAASLPDGTAIAAAAATAANSAVGAAAPPAGTGPAAPAAAAASGAGAQLAAAAGAAPAAGPHPAAEGHPGPGQQPRGQDGAAAPPRPRTPPRKDQAALVRQQNQRQSQKQGGGAGTAGTGTEGSETAATAAAASSSSVPSVHDSSLPQPPPEVAAMGAANSGEGVMGVHTLPPVCRGTLADEYGILWRVRTAELQEAATIALVRDAEAVALEAAMRSPPKRGGSPPKRMDTMTMGLAAAAAPPPPYAPERAARLQLLIDVLAAAQEPLEWAQLARVVIAAEPPAVPTAVPTATTTPAATPAGTPLRNTRSQLTVAPAAAAASAEVVTTPGSPVRRSMTPLGARGGEVDRVRGSGGGADDGSGGRATPVYGGARESRSGRDMGVVASCALRDLDWALQEGPLAGLVWISGCGKVSVRHSSFLDWLRRVSVAVAAAAAAAPAPPTTAAGAAVAAAAVVSTGSAAAVRAAAAISATAAATPDGTAGAAAPVPPRPLGIPDAQRGHAVLARLLRQQLLSGWLASTSGAPGASAGALRRPGSASSMTRGSSEAGGTAAYMSLARQAPVPSSAGFGMGLGGGSKRSSSSSTPPPASVYCLRHVITHCAEGRLPASEIEATILDLDYWRQVLEGAHLEMVASSLEHLLRTRGPHARRPSTPQHQQPHHQQLPSGMLPRTPPPAGATAAVVRGTSPAPGAGTAAAAATGKPAADAAATKPAASAAAAKPAAGAAAAKPAASAAAAKPTATSKAVPSSGARATGATALSSVSASVSSGGAAGGASVPVGTATAAATAAARVRESREGREAREARAPTAAALPAATSSLLRDALLWLSQDGRSLMRRPDQLNLACSASCTPLQSPFRKLAEQITAAAAAVAAAAAADALFPPPLPLRTPPSSSLGGSGGVAAAAATPLRPVTPGLPPPTAGSSVGGAGSEPLYPPSFVTAMPHPRFRSPVMRAAECPHRVTSLLSSEDGEVVLATGECAEQASLIDTLSGRRAMLLIAGPGAHHAALSAAAFAPARPLLATAGSEPGSITLWDLTTGAPRAQLHLLRGRDIGRRITSARKTPAAAVAAAPAAGSLLPTAAAAAAAAAPTAAVAAASPRTVASPASAASIRRTSSASSSKPAAVAAVSVAASSPSTSGDGTEATDQTETPLESAPAPAPAPVIPATPARNDPWVSCIAIYEPGPGASATSYGAPAGSRLVSSSAEAAEAASSAAAAGEMVIVRGSALVAAGDSASGKVVLWAVAPDGWGATRTAELLPPAGTSDSRGGGGVVWLGFLPGGKTLIVVQSCSTALRLWNVQSRNVTATIRLPPICGEVFAVHLAPPPPSAAPGADTLLAAVCTSSTELWALERRQALAALPFGAGAVGGRAWANSCVAFSPAGGLLATAGALVTPQASTAGSGGGAAAAVSQRPSTSAVPPVPVLDVGAATLWDARSGSQVLQLRGLRSPIRALAFSPDGSLLATSVTDATVVLWSAATGACLSVLPLPLGQDEVVDVPAVTFGRQGAVLMAAAGTGVFTWDVQLAVAAAAADAAAAGAAGAGAAALAAPRGRTPMTGLGAAGAPYGMRRSGVILTESSGHRDRVSTVCFGPGGVLALSGGEDSTIRLWDAFRHSELVAVEQPGAIHNLAWSADGSLVAAALSNGTAHVWHFEPAIATSPTAAAAHGDFTTREAARLRCTANDEDASCTTMDGVGFSHDGRMLYTADGEGRVSVWSVHDWKLIGTAVPCVRPSRAALLRSAAAAAGGGGDADASAGVGSGTLVGRYAGASFTADGRWLLLGCGREVMMWSIKSLREAKDRLGPHGAPVTAIVTSPCGNFAAVAAGSAITIWGTPKAGGGAARGGGGAGGGGNSVSFRVGPGDSGPQSPFSPRVTLLPALSEVTGLAFSADGELLAASLADGSLRVWETGRWKEVGWLSGHVGGAACCVAFNPDGRVLLSGGADCRCLSWSTRDVLQPASGSVSGSMDGS